MKELKIDIQAEYQADMVRQIMDTETEKFQESVLKSLLEKQGIFNING